MIKCANCKVCEAKDKGHVDSFDEDNTAWITFEGEDDVQYQVVVEDIKCSENIQLGSIICLKHDNSMCVCEDQWEESDMEQIKLDAEKIKKALEEILNDRR